MNEQIDYGLTIKGLRKSYKHRVAVDGIDLRIKQGEIYGLIGPDGAGKTTVMRTVCGLLLPNEGDVRVMGYDPVTQHRAVRERIGYMPQRFSLYPDLTVRENLKFFADIYGVTPKEYENRVPELMNFSRLGPFQNRRASALSGGMKQKLALICTLIHTPEVLVLDEPTFGVDPVSRKEFWDILGRLKTDGLTLLVSTAYMDEAKLCDHLGLMHNGKIVTTGTPQEVINTFPNKLLEIRGESITELSDALKSAALTNVGIHRFGDCLHAVYNEEPDARELERITALHGGTVKPIRADVEDVFVALASGENCES